jgi:hypothetical protein
VVAKGGDSLCGDDDDGLVIAVDAAHVYWIAGAPSPRSDDGVVLLLLCARK